MEAAEVQPQQEQQPQEWEQAKENMAPLRAGRNRAALQEATNSISQLTLEHERKQLLQAIDEYKGDDPLEPWLKLIKWTQEHLVTCGKAELQKVLHSCTSCLANNPRYAADKRYLRVWVHYADCLPDPSDVFLFLKEKGIGLDHALYYEAYATYFELKGNCPAAEAVYSDGIRRLAQPVERLKQKYSAFQSRMAQRIQRRIQEEASGVPSTTSTAEQQPTSMGSRASLAPLVPVAPHSSLLAPAAGLTGPGRPAPMLGRGRGGGLPQGPGLLGVSNLPTQPSRQPSSNSFLLPHQQQQQQQAGGFQAGVLSGLVAASARQAAGVAGQPQARPVAVATDEEFKQGGAAPSTVPGYATLPQGVSNLKMLKPYGVMRKENQEAPAMWAGSTLPQAAPGGYAPGPAPRLDICVDDEFQDDGSSGPSGSAAGSGSGTAAPAAGPGALTLSSLLQAKSSAASVPSVLAGPGLAGTASHAALASQSLLGGSALASQSLLGGSAAGPGLSLLGGASRPAGLLQPGARSSLASLGQAAGTGATPSVAPLAGRMLQGDLGTQPGVGTAAAGIRQQDVRQPLHAAAKVLQSESMGRQTLAASAPSASSAPINGINAAPQQQQQQAGQHATKAALQQQQPTPSNGHNAAPVVSPNVPVGELSIEEMRARAWWSRHPHIQTSSCSSSRQELSWEQCWQQQQQQQQQEKQHCQQRQQQQPASGTDIVQQVGVALPGTHHSAMAASSSSSWQTAAGSKPGSDSAVAVRNTRSAAGGMRQQHATDAYLQAREEAQQLNQTDCFLAPELSMAPPARPEPTITIATRAAFDALNDMFGTTAAQQHSLPQPSLPQHGNHSRPLGMQAQQKSSAAASVAAHQQGPPVVPAAHATGRRPLGMIAAAPVDTPSPCTIGPGSVLSTQHASSGQQRSTMADDTRAASSSSSGVEGGHMGSSQPASLQLSSSSNARGYAEPTCTINTKAAFDALNEMWCDALPHEDLQRAHRAASEQQQAQMPGLTAADDEQVTRMPSLPASMKHITSMDVLRLANKCGGNRTQSLSQATSIPGHALVSGSRNSQAMQASCSLQIHEDTELLPAAAVALSAVTGMQQQQQQQDAAGLDRRQGRCTATAHPGFGPAGIHVAGELQPPQPAGSSLMIYEDTVCGEGGLRAAASAAAGGGSFRHHRAEGQAPAAAASMPSGNSLQLYEDTEFIAGAAAASNVQRSHSGLWPRS